jgi:hypothetical protein
LKARFESLQSGGLFGVVFDQVGKGLELRFQLLVGFPVRLKKSWIAGEQKSPQSSLFVDHQFDQVVGVCNDLIATIYPARTPLHLLNPISQGQCKQAKGDNWKCQQTEKQTSIGCGFQMFSPGAAVCDQELA